VRSAFRTGTETDNALYYGDNLDVLRRHIKDESVDLIYLDPPFNSNATYDVHVSAQDARTAFEDTWRWDEAAARSYQETVAFGGRVAEAMRAFRTFLGDSNLLAYLAMMAPRLAELRRVLKATGTIYLHCDPTASHYLKLLMDAVFGAENFRNEIVWCYAGGGIPRRDFPRKHDVILRYSVSADYFYAPIHRPYSEGTQQRGRTRVKGKYFEAGLRPEGTPVNDWWADVPKITSPSDPEKSGYPTQKSEALLERILTASSREGDLVLDPFCGSGTTLAVAQKMARRWIGIDINRFAIELTERRLQNTFDLRRAI
jgi:DNA modification methylase